MSAPEPKLTRKKQAAQTKKNIFNAARELLVGRPLENITIQEIVSKAGVSVGTFYLYFSAKQDVFFEAHTESDQNFTAHVKPALKNKSAEECLDLFMRTYGSSVAHDIGRRMVKLMFSPNNQFFNRRGPNTVPGILIGIAKKGLQDGELSKDMSAEEIADLYLAMARGLIHDWSSKEEDYDLAERMVKFGRKLFQAIKA